MLILFFRRQLGVVFMLFSFAAFSQVRNILPMFQARTDGMYITTADYALYRISPLGKLEQLQPPPTDFAGPIPLFYDSPERFFGGYQSTDGRLVLYANAITREDPFFLSPKPGRKLLQVTPTGASDALAIWAEGKNVIIDLYKSPKETIYEMPQVPVAAIGYLGKLYISCQAGPSSKINTYRFYNDDIELLTKFGGNVVAVNRTSSGMNMVSMVQSTKGTDSIYLNIDDETAGNKPPLPGLYTCLVLGTNSVIISNAAGVCWQGWINIHNDRKLEWLKLDKPAGAGFVGASYIVNAANAEVGDLALVNRQQQLFWPRTDIANASLVYRTVGVEGLQPLLAKRTFKNETAQPEPGNATAKPNSKTSTKPGAATAPSASTATIGVTNLGKMTFSPVDIDGEGYLATGTRQSYTDVPYTQQVIDMNNDGHADLLTTYTEASYIDMFFNNGSGKLSTHSRVKLGTYGRKVVAAHLNDDKLMDLVWREGKDSSIHILMGEGANTFRHLQFNGLKAAYFELHDYDANGSMDIVFTGGILLNNGKAAFTFFTTEMEHRNAEGLITGNNVGPEYLGAIGDLDGNGAADFIEVNWLFSSLTVRLMPAVKNLKTGIFNPPIQTFSIKAPFKVLTAAAADFNGDGRLDLVLGCKEVGKVLFYINKGGNQFDLVTIGEGGYSADATPIMVMDADKDGLPDAVIGQSGMAMVYGCSKTNAVPRAKVEKWTTNPKMEPNVGAYAVGDITGDGIPDNVVFNGALSKIDGTLACGAEYCFSMMLHRGISSDGKFAFADNESPNSLAKIIERQKKRQEEEDEKKRRSKTGEGSGTTQTKTPTTTEQQPTNLLHGIAIYTGRSSEGLRVEVEAEVWYENRAPKGMAGFKYRHIYKTSTIRYRFPTNGSRWYSFSGNTIDHCPDVGNCIWIGGMRFSLNEPGISLL